MSAPPASPKRRVNVTIVAPGLLEGRWHGLLYRARSRLLHRFSLHHTRAHHMDDGTTLHRCDWCGMSRVEVPTWLIEKRIREANYERINNR